MQNPTTENQNTGNAPTITKRIRTTDYIVGIHFSTTSKENIKDKVFRLIKNEIANSTSSESPHS